MASAYIEINPKNARKLAAELLKLAEQVEQSGKADGYAYTTECSVHGPNEMTNAKFIVRNGLED